MTTPGPVAGDGVICPVCSVANAPGANFCTACGAELPESDDSATGAYPLLGVDIPDVGEVGQLVIVRGATAGARYAIDEPVTPTVRSSWTTSPSPDVTPKSAARTAGSSSLPMWVR